MAMAIVTSKGQVVVPSKIRRKLNIKKGTKLYIEERQDDFVVIPITPAYFKKIPGVVSTKGKLSSGLLKERAREREA